MGYPDSSVVLDADLDVGVAEGLPPGVRLRAASLVSTAFLKTRAAVSVAGGGSQQRALTPKFCIISSGANRVSTEVEVLLELRGTVRSSGWGQGVAENGRGNGVLKVVLEEGGIGRTSSVLPQALPRVSPLRVVGDSLRGRGLKPRVAVPLLGEVTPLFDGPWQLLGMASHRVLLTHGHVEVVPLPPPSRSLSPPPLLLLLVSSLLAATSLLLPPHSLLVMAAALVSSLFPESRTALVSRAGGDGLRV